MHSQPGTPVRANPISSPVDQLGAPVRYRIEECRRTIFVDSPMTQENWDFLALKLVDTGPGGGEPSSHTVTQTDAFPGPGGGSRAVTLSEMHITQDGSPNPNPENGPVSPVKSQPGRDRSPNELHQLANGLPNSPVRRRGSPTPPHTRPRILFYHSHDPHYGFTNFSPHAVEYNGKTYPTSEHLFQSFKFEHKPNLAEHIRTCSQRPSQAFAEARRFAPEVRLDWKKVNIQKMDVTLWHKFMQHLDLKEELLATGNAELIEDSDKDAFWGWGADRKGENQLGKALERLRDKLRNHL